MMTSACNVGTCRVPTLLRCMQRAHGVRRGSVVVVTVEVTAVVAVVMVTEIAVVAVVKAVMTSLSTVEVIVTSLNASARKREKK